MPLVEIFLRAGKAPDYVRAVTDGVHQALVSQASVPADDRFQIVHQTDDTTLIAHPSYGGVSRSPDLIVVKITLNAGRAVEVKKNLYAEIARNLEKGAGVRADDVLICLIEVTKENWSFGGGRATYA